MPLRLIPALLALLGAATALMLPGPSQPPPAPPARGASAMDNPLHRRIDEWIARNGLNPYGDPPGTMYMGSTPLFDERTGITKDRYQYILERHPELKENGSRER